MYSVLRNLRVSVDQRITHITSEINSAEEDNTRKKRLEEDIVTESKLLEDVTSYHRAFKALLTRAMTEADTYRKSRKSELESRVESALNLVFPEEHFKVHFEVDVSNRKYVAELLLGKEVDGIMYWGTPRGQNGGMAKQLIAFTAVGEINLMIGSDLYIADEPFSSSDDFNILAVKAILKYFNENGLQVLIIEHKPSLYEGIEHNKIKLTKDRANQNGKVQLLSIERCCPKDEGDNSDISTA